MMFPFLVQERKHTKNINQREVEKGGNPPRPANCFLPIWEGNLGCVVLEENDFRKSFSPKPACLVATKNEIFRKIISCWPKFTPLTQKWFYTLIFTSNHFRKKRERERRESPDRRERGRRDFAGDHRPSSSRTIAPRRSSIAAPSCSSIAPLVDRSTAPFDLVARSRLWSRRSISPPPLDLIFSSAARSQFDQIWWIFCWVLFLLPNLMHFL